MVFDLGYPAHQANFAGSGERGTSLQQVFAMFPSEESCLRHVFHANYGEHPMCPRCGEPCKWSIDRHQRQLVHHRCKASIAPCVGTAMERSRIPIQLWFYTMLHVANSRESVSSSFLARHLGVSRRAAHRMLMRIRAHLAALDHRELIGTVEGEACVRIERIGGMKTPSKRSPNTAQVLLIEADGAVRTIVLNHHRPHRVRGLLMRRLAAGVRVVTTCGQTARLVSFYGRFASPTIAPADKDEVAGRPADLITAFLTSFRRGMRIQHQSVSPRFFWLFLKEYEFRFNRRARSDQVFADMIARFPRVDESAMTALRAAYCDLADCE